MAKTDRTGAAPRGPEGSNLRASGKDGPQLVTSGGHRWTDEAEEIFLDHLAASCNVTRSAQATGFSREAIYARRRRDPAFATRWQEAIVQGHARIEAGLVAAAIATLEGRAPDPDFPIPPMSVTEMIAVLKLHGPAVRGEGKRPGWRGRPRSLDEVKQSILRKLAAYDRAGGKA